MVEKDERDFLGAIKSFSDQGSWERWPGEGVSLRAATDRVIGCRQLLAAIVCLCGSGWKREAKDC